MPSRLTSIESQAGRIPSVETAADTTVTLAEANISATTFFTAPSGMTSEYLLEAYIACTHIGGASSKYTLGIVHTDPDIDAAQTHAALIDLTISAATGVASATKVLRCKTATAVQYSITGAGTMTAATGKLYLRLTRLK